MERPLATQPPKYIEFSTCPTINLMCTTNSYKSISEINDKGEFVAHFPYQQPFHVNKSAITKGKTPYQVLKMNLTRRMLHDDLMAERIKWVTAEKHKSDLLGKRQNLAALKIQCQFRGFSTRKKITSERHPPRKAKPIKRPGVSLNRRAIHDDLRQFAADLQLKPIPGLSLDAVAKKSKNKEAISIAAAVQIQCFIRIQLSHRIFQVRMHLAEKKRRARAGSLIKRFFHHVHDIKMFQLKQQRICKDAAITIQKYVRRKLAINRSKLRKQLLIISRRQKEAVVKLTRTFRRLLHEKRTAGTLGRRKLESVAVEEQKEVTMEREDGGSEELLLPQAIGVEIAAGLVDPAVSPDGETSESSPQILLKDQEEEEEGDSYEEDFTSLEASMEEDKQEEQPRSPRNSNTSHTWLSTDAIQATESAKHQREEEATILISSTLSAHDNEEDEVAIADVFPPDQDQDPYDEGCSYEEEFSSLEDSSHAELNKRDPLLNSSVDAAEVLADIQRLEVASAVETLISAAVRSSLLLTSTDIHEELSHNEEHTRESGDVIL